MSPLERLVALALLGSASAGCAVDFRRHFAEECGNGVDDDEDGKLDCADEDCGSATCAPPAPEGWLGPVLVVYDGDTCPEGTEPRATGNVCGGCGCEGSVTCGSASVSFGDAGCPAPLDQSLPVGDGACVELGVSGGSLGALGDIPVASAACTPSGTGGFRAAAICESAGGGGCATGTTCFPEAEGACVSRDGDWPCPEGFPARRTFAAGEIAGCTACACEPSPPACSGTTTLFADNGCIGTQATITHDGLACAVLSETPQSARFAAAPAPACAPVGGLPEGATAVTTICCLL